jgi:hypothetical protein
MSLHFEHPWRRVAGQQSLSYIKCQLTFGERNMWPPLELVSNVVYTLHTLDAETDKGLGCASSVREHGRCINATLEMALAVKYGAVSGASRRLGRRLLEPYDTLVHLGIFSKSARPLSGTRDEEHSTAP